MATVITSADVVSQFGAFYQDAGQNENNIHDSLRESLSESGDFTMVDTEDTVLREANVQYQEVLQSFQTTFTPKGGVTFTPKPIQLFNVKVDEAFYPDALKNSWLGFMVDNSLDRTQMPFVKWFIEQYVLKQITTDIIKNMYAASYVAPTPGVAGAANQAFDGLKKIINLGISGGSIVPIPTGAPSATPETWVNQVEGFTAQIPEVYWTTKMGIKMSRALALRYKQGRRVKYNSNYAQISDKTVVEDFEDFSIEGRASLTGSTKIWTSPKMNTIMAMKGGSNSSIVEVEKVDRMVKVYTDFWIGMGFINDALVYTNDQELV